MTSVLKLHRATKQSLVHTIEDQGRENIKLRKLVVEFEVYLRPFPLFSWPLYIMEMINFVAQNLEVDGSTKLLNGIHGFVAQKIKMRIDIIFKSQEILVECTNST